ncbi:hypothetical protein FMEAI12_4530015 [Parafrankia sp. Ea1.12]|nr:hypothetical protein FMEAI12_4530015 [Parafrankia sp. Ea1.12]
MINIPILGSLVVVVVATIFLDYPMAPIDAEHLFVRMPNILDSIKKCPERKILPM